MDRVRGLLDRDEERWVRGTGGVCRSRGDRGVEPSGYLYLDTRGSRTNVLEWFVNKSHRSSNVKPLCL